MTDNSDRYGLGISIRAAVVDCLAIFGWQLVVSMFWALLSENVSDALAITTLVVVPISLYLICVTACQRSLGMILTSTSWTTLSGEPASRERVVIRAMLGLVLSPFYLVQLYLAALFNQDLVLLDLLLKMQMRRTTQYRSRAAFPVIMRNDIQVEDKEVGRGKE